MRVFQGNPWLGQRMIGRVATFLLVLSAWAATASTTMQQSAPAASPSHSGQASTSAATPPAPKPPAISPAATRRDAWKVLTGGVAEKDSDRHAQAISALGTIGATPDVVKLVEGGLTDKSPTVRQMAATTLGAMKSRGSVPKLRVALDDNAPEVVFAAAQALWQMGDKSGESIFIEVLQGDRKVSPGPIQQGLNYAHQELHDPAALARLGAEQAAGAFLGPLGFGVTVVEDLAKDKSAPVRTVCARLLGSNADSVAQDALEQALDDKSWIVRATVATALGAGSASALVKLAPLLNDDHREVRYSAAAAIVRLTAPR